MSAAQGAGARRALPLAAAVVVGGLMLARVAWFAQAPEAVRVGAVPDHAFHHLQMARYRAELGRWPLDATAPATRLHFS